MVFDINKVIVDVTKLVEGKKYFYHNNTNCLRAAVQQAQWYTSVREFHKSGMSNDACEQFVWYPLDEDEQEVLRKKAILDKIAYEKKQIVELQKQYKDKNYNPFSA